MSVCGEVRNLIFWWKKRSADVLNRQIKCDGKEKQITVLSDVLSYSQFKESSCVKEEQVKKFYFDFGIRRS